MRKLKELSKDELKNLYRTNNGFQNKVYELAYNESMLSQEMEALEMGTKVFDYHDNYTSFYLTTPMQQGLKSPELVAHALNESYMTEENKELYKKLNELTDKWENMTYDEQEKHEELYNEMTEVCDELADGITTQLKIYEEVGEAEALDTLYDDIECGYYDNFEVNDEGNVYENITKVYK